MPGLNEAGAAARFAAIGNALKTVDVQHSVSVGLAAAQPGDNLEALLARADADRSKAGATGDADRTDAAAFFRPVPRRP